MVRLLLLMVIWFYIDCFFTGCNAANILGVTWYPATSHQIFFHPIFSELSLRGHQVTLITPVPIRNRSLTNLTEIDVGFLFEIHRKSDFTSKLSASSWIWESVIYTKLIVQEFFEALLKSNDVKALIRSNKKFDVVIAEAHSPLVFAFGERFQAPVIGKNEEHLFALRKNSVVN